MSEHSDWFLHNEKANLSDLRLNNSDSLTAVVRFRNCCETNLKGVMFAPIPGGFKEISSFLENLFTFLRRRLFCAFQPLTSFRA